MTTRYISTKETAAMLRKDLAKAWPGVKFSVRMGTGTGSAWLSVSYTDGPTYTVLLVTAGDDFPEEVRFSCDGINSHREYSPAARLHAQRILDGEGHRDIRTCTDTGEPINNGPMPAELYVAGHFHDYLYSPAGLADRILSNVDLSTVTGASNR